MTTGYEAGMYRDITLIREALQGINRSLKVLADSATPPLEPPPDTSWAHTIEIKET